MLTLSHLPAHNSGTQALTQVPRERWALPPSPGSQGKEGGFSRTHYHFPYLECPGPPLGPDPPWPLNLTLPCSSPKYDVTAECPVDVQVHLCDVSGGDQVLLSHFLWENRGGGAGVRDTDPDLSPGALLG